MRDAESTPTSAETSDAHIILAPLFRRKGRKVTLDETPLSAKPEPVRRPAHVAKMLALAHHLQNAIERGLAPDQATIARTLELTRARVTQLLDLTLIAPDVQARILELEAVDGVEPLAERQLRAVVAAGLWPEQRAAWAEITRATESPCMNKAKE